MPNKNLNLCINYGDALSVTPEHLTSFKQFLSHFNDLPPAPQMSIFHPLFQLQKEARHPFPVQRQTLYSLASKIIRDSAKINPHLDIFVRYYTLFLFSGERPWVEGDFFTINLHTIPTLYTEFYDKLLFFTKSKDSARIAHKLELMKTKHAYERHNLKKALLLSVAFSQLTSIPEVVSMWSTTLGKKKSATSNLTKLNVVGKGSFFRVKVKMDDKLFENLFPLIGKSGTLIVPLFSNKNHSLRWKLHKTRPIKNLFEGGNTIREVISNKSYKTPIFTRNENFIELDEAIKYGYGDDSLHVINNKGPELAALHTKISNMPFKISLQKEKLTVFRQSKTYSTTLIEETTPNHGKNLPEFFQAATMQENDIFYMITAGDSRFRKNELNTPLNFQHLREARVVISSPESLDTIESAYPLELQNDPHLLLYKNYLDQKQQVHYRRLLTKRGLGHEESSFKYILQNNILFLLILNFSEKEKKSTSVADCYENGLYFLQLTEKHFSNNKDNGGKEIEEFGKKKKKSFSSKQITEAYDSIFLLLNYGKNKCLPDSFLFLDASANALQGDTIFAAPRHPTLGNLVNLQNPSCSIKVPSTETIDIYEKFTTQIFKILQFLKEGGTIEAFNQMPDFQQTILDSLIEKIIELLSRSTSKTVLMPFIYGLTRYGATARLKEALPTLTHDEIFYFSHIVGVALTLADAHFGLKRNLAQKFAKIIVQDKTNHIFLNSLEFPVSNGQSTEYKQLTNLNLSIRSNRIKLNKLQKKIRLADVEETQMDKLTEAIEKLTASIQKAELRKKHKNCIRDATTQDVIAPVLQRFTIPVFNDDGARIGSIKPQYINKTLTSDLKKIATSMAVFNIHCCDGTVLLRVFQQLQKISIATIHDSLGARPELIPLVAHLFRQAFYEEARGTTKHNFILNGGHLIYKKLEHFDGGENYPTKKKSEEFNHLLQLVYDIYFYETLENFDMDRLLAITKQADVPLDFIFINNAQLNLEEELIKIKIMSFLVNKPGQPHLRNPKQYLVEWLQSYEKTLHTLEVQLTPQFFLHRAFGF